MSRGRRGLLPAALLAVASGVAIVSGDGRVHDESRWVLVDTGSQSSLRPFVMDRHELTWAEAAWGFDWALQNARCVIATARDGRAVLVARGDGRRLLTVNPDLRLDSGRLKPVAGRERHPCRFLTWYGAVSLCNWLSERDGLEPVYDLARWSWDRSRDGHRLPTSEEWEYAARGGNRASGGVYAGGTRLAELGWYKANAGGDTHAVGQKRANELGLFDMSGNVWEWCWDPYTGSEIYPPAPTSEASADPRCERGGSFYNAPGDHRVDRVIGVRADVGFIADGLRLVRNARASGSR